MKLLGYLILFAGVPFAQVSPRRYLETAASDVSAHVVWTQPVGLLESGETRAVFTALSVMDPMHAGEQLRGVRVDLSMPGWNGVAYVQESDVSVMKKLADLLAKYAKKYPNETAPFSALNSHSDPTPAFFLSYQRKGNNPTLYLGLPRSHSLEFTGVPPSDLAAIFASAAKTLRAQ
ncbi:MAG: hypothetical protein ACLQKA_24965 [Bryobacteraceae bacterium]